MNKRYLFLFVYVSVLLVTTLFVGGCDKGGGDSDGELLAELDLTSKSEILRRVLSSQPLRGGDIPENISNIVGANHVAGLYYLTDEPFLIEGAKAIKNIGSNVIKVWFLANHWAGKASYPFNHNWPTIDSNTRLVDLAKISYYEQLFEMDFSTFILLAQVNLPHHWTGGVEGKEEYFKEVEDQFYELTKHLLITYHDRDVTFILQNWEGDWLLRGGGKRGAPDTWNVDIDDRVSGMIEWFKARQRGVNRARNEVNSSRAVVAHAIEVNRVLDALDGIPTVISHVVPYVETDLVSYSAYDSALSDMPTGFWHALEIINYFTNPSELYDSNNIYVGEIGNPETGKTQKYITDWWDKAFGVMLEFDIPYILMWEVYCKGPIDMRTVEPGTTLPAEELRGFWLIRPDGSYSYAGEYFMDLLN